MGYNNPISTARKEPRYLHRKTHGAANPQQPEYIEEVEVYRRRPGWIGQVARWFLPYTSPVATNTKVYRVADAGTPYLKPVVALPRMAGEPMPYDR